ncbi:Uncharacterised protein [Klebsiella pneumoniae]|nr:Uncharacterised protein [Klebsiella pneumoniae]
MIKDFSESLMLLYGGVVIYSFFHNEFYYVILFAAFAFSLINRLCK